MKKPSELMVITIKKSEIFLKLFPKSGGLYSLRSDPDPKTDDTRFGTGNK
jgi:hypothetical protein